MKIVIYDSKSFFLYFNIRSDLIFFWKKKNNKKQMKHIFFLQMKLQVT